MQYISWKTFFDIFILTFIIYSLYKTLRATGTWKIAISLISAGIIASTARFFDLQGIDWLFSNFSQIIIIALIIIFQPEIRRILERSTILNLFNKPFSTRFHRAAKKQFSTANIIGSTLFDLAERRWGGLIVIPGKTPLKDWTTGGTAIDAIPSTSLLLSLFDDGSPGHDGAVIVEKGRISRFGARLPLSESGYLAESYGTRHHAALGLCEQTDALVLLVSEERGTVSYFKKGTMIPLAESDDVIKVMAEHLEEPTSNKASLFSKESLLTIGEVTTCLMIATLFWFTLVQPKTETKERLFTIPIEYTKNEKNIQIIKEQEEAIILLAGPEASLNRINPASLPIKVDLSGLEPGTHQINITSDKISVPRNIKILQVQPDTLQVELQHHKVRKAKIRPQFIGTLAEGVQLNSVIVTPDVFSVIDKEKNNDGGELEITTTPIYLANIRQSTTVYCKVILPKGLQLENSKVSDVAVTLSINAEKDKM